MEGEDTVIDNSKRSLDIESEQLANKKVKNTNSDQGDNWTCIQCGNVNWPKRTYCNNSRCRAPRHGNDSTNGASTQPESPEGSWVCYIPGCGNVNWPNRTVCNRRNCQAPKYLGVFQMRTIQMLDEQNVPPGSWVCPRCQNANYPQRTTCNRCRSTQRPPLTPGKAFPMSQSLLNQPLLTRMGDMSSMGGLGAAIAGMAGMGGMAAMGGITGMGGGMGGGMRGVGNEHPPGSWVCSVCQNVNWPQRSVCNGKGCNVNRPETSSNDAMSMPSIPSFGNYPHNLVKDGMPFVPYPNNMNMKSKYPPGSWQCGACNNINWPHRTICNSNNCLAPRPTGSECEQIRENSSIVGITSGSHPSGSWICPTCQNVNWPQREVCNMKNCDTPKPADGDHQTV